jgi:hypothetical protein
MGNIKKFFATKLLWRRRGLGMNPNPYDRRDFVYDYKMKSGVFQETSSLELYSEVVDQLNTSSCIGNALAGAIRILENKKQHENSYLKYSYPSRMFLYWNSRILHDVIPLKDDGTYIRTCCKGLMKYGVPDEIDWPFIKNKVNRKPIFNTWMRADARKGGEYFAIFDAGKDRINAIMTAICEGYPVIFGTQISDSFMSPIGDTVIYKPKSSDVIVGNHCMVIVGYRVVSGNIQFRVMNSWGKYWRDYGYCWLDSDYVASSKSRDFTIIKGWRNLG